MRLLKSWKLFLLCFVLALGIAAGLTAWWAWRQGLAPRPGGITSTGGAPLELSLVEPALHFAQRDPRWAEASLGDTEEKVGAVGCTLCCVAMALRHYGIDTDPGRLNASLTALPSSGGFTPQGWLVWSGVEKVSADKVKVTVHAQPNHAALDDHLRRGELVTVKFFLPGGIPRWVLVVGKRGRDYLIHDPAYRQAHPQPLTLTERTRQIYSMRAFAFKKEAAIATAAAGKAVSPPGP